MEALEQRLVPTIVVMGGVASEASGSLVFMIMGINASSMPLVLNYATVDGTADSNTLGDFTAVSGSFTVSPWDVISLPISVPINNDTINEGSESFTLNVTGDDAGVGIGTIQDDDAGSTDPTDPTDPTDVNDPPSFGTRPKTTPYFWTSSLIYTLGKSNMLVKSTLIPKSSEVRHSQ